MACGIKVNGAASMGAVAPGDCPKTSLRLASGPSLVNRTAWAKGVERKSERYVEGMVDQCTIQTPLDHHIADITPFGDRVGVER
jgi:hypothetical protein